MIDLDDSKISKSTGIQNAVILLLVEDEILNWNPLMAAAIKHQENQLWQYAGDVIIFIVIRSIRVLHDGKNRRCGRESKILYIYGLIRFLNQTIFNLNLKI